MLTVNRKLQKLKSIIEERRLQEDIKQLGEAATRRAIISLSVDRCRKGSLYWCLLLWLGITHTHTCLGQTRERPPRVWSIMLTSSVIKPASTVLYNFEGEKKREPGSATAFLGKLKTTHRPFQLRISRELLVDLLKKKSLNVFALIFGFFFSRDNSA